jgi:hypothetical protein
MKNLTSTGISSHLPSSTMITSLPKNGRSVTAPAYCPLGGVRAPVWTPQRRQDTQQQCCDRQD